MQGTISPGLQKLMQSVQELKQVSSPQTSSGAPTIAAQVEQAASQVAAQVAPPAEMPGMLPNDSYRAQLMQTLQAQAQEQAQRMAMLAQGQPPQGRAEGGIASLPGSDVEMAEGGVVGYAGPKGSFIGNLTAEEIERMPLDMRKAYFKEMLERRNAPISTPTASTATSAASMRPGLGMAGAIAKKLGPLGLLAELFTTPEEDIALLQKAEAERNAVPSDDRPRGQENYEPLPPVVAPDVAEAMRSGYASFPGSDRGRGNALPARNITAGSQQNLPSSGERKQTVQPPAADKGIAALVGPPVPSGSERQFGEALSALGKLSEPSKRTPEQIAAEREALYRARGIEPGKAEQERIAKLEAFDAQEEAERKKRVEQRGMQDLITFLTGFGGASSMVAGGRRGSEASAQLQQGWERSDEAYNLLKRQRMDAIAAERVALDNRNRALADGDIATAAKEAEAVRTAQNARLTAEAELRGRFAPQLLQAETAAADRASREREGAEGRANAIELERMRRATANQPGETERILAEFNRLKARDPAAAEQYLQNIERIKGSGKGLEQRASAAEEANRIRRQKLLADDPIYKMARFEYFQATDPAKKADAQRRMKEIERANGIVDEAGPASSATQIPPGVTVKKVGP